MRLGKIFLAIVFVIGSVSSYAQLHFEDFVFDGANGGALLNEASSVAVSPDGAFVYVTSAGSNAINLYSKDSGSPGELTFVELYKSGVDGIEGLTSAQSIVISPDGNHAYAVGTADDALVTFQRNSVDGKLTYLQMYKDGFSGVDGLDGAYQVVMSPDGKNVYVSGTDDSAIAVFTRDANSGMLTFLEKIQQGSNGISGLQIVFGITISPDGQHLYAAGHLENSITVFDRHTLTGALTYAGSVTDDINGIDGLSGPFSVFVSHDGNNVYATGAYDNAVTVFNRNPTSGILSFVNYYGDGGTGGAKMNFPVFVTGSNDGNYVYVAGANDNSINTFSRNPITGELAFYDAKTEGIAGVTGINFPVNIAVSSDDDFVYTASTGSNALATFNRNGAGILDFQETLVSGGAGVDGLDDPYSLVVSPDGKHIYVASNDDNAVAIFSRNQSSGKINFIDLVVDDIAGVDGLYKTSAVAISPDGNNVYATGNNDDAVAVFSRDAITGELTFVEFFEDDENGIDGMNGARDVTVSPDGKNVYVIGYFDDALVTFARDENTGQLTYIDQQEDGKNGVDGLKRASSVMISSDGMFAYATGYTDDAIAVFSRNPADGILTYMTNYKNGLMGISGLNGALSVIISFDGMHAYACGFNDGAVVVFSRDPATGMLSYETTYFDGVGGVDGLTGIRAIAINPDDQHFYAVSGGENAIVLFERNASSGKLTYQMKHEDGVANVDGLSGARGLAVSPYGRFIYVAGSSDNALSIFSCTYLDEITEEICEGSVYTIGNNTYNQTGVFADTTAGQVGCRTITELDLTVYGTSESIAAIICEGEEYPFGAQMLTTTGVYEETEINGAGCTVTTTLDLSVTDQIQIDLIETICEGDAFQVGSNTFNSSGIYTNNLTTVEGCDSIVTLDLTVQENSYFINETICSGETYVLGNNTFTQTGIYQETLPAFTGCDSVINLQLVVVDAFEEIIETTICEGSSYILGDNIYTQTGTYQQTLTSNAGCDSIVTLDLEVTSSSINLWLNRSICQGEVYDFQGTEYAESGVYSKSFSTSTGCDSMVTLNLFVLPNPPQQLVETICEGETYAFGTNSYSQSGTYTNTFENPNGCEQMVTLDLIVQPENNISVDITICEGEAYSFGDNMLTIAGIYNDQLSTIAGCDSIVTLDLSVTPKIEKTIFRTICTDDSYSFGGDDYSDAGTYQKTFTSFETGCDSLVELNLTVTEINSNALISNDEGSNNGMINQTPTNGMAPYIFEWNDGNEDEDRTDLATGHYLVTITDDNGCSNVFVHHVDFSTSTKNIEDIKYFEVLAQPNPVASYTTFNLDFTIEKDREIEIKLFDMRGQSLRTEHLQLKRGTHLHAIPSPNVEGIYFVQILSEGEQLKTLKVMVHN